MIKMFTLAATAVLITSCASHQDRPARIGMANPAAVYCQKIGGRLDIVKEPAGETGYCTLPGGERIEEWALYRRDNAQ